MAEAVAGIEQDGFTRSDLGALIKSPLSSRYKMTAPISTSSAFSSMPVVSVSITQNVVLKILS